MSRVGDALVSGPRGVPLPTWRWERAELGGGARSRTARRRECHHPGAVSVVRSTADPTDPHAAEPSHGQTPRSVGRIRTAPPQDPATDVEQVPVSGCTLATRHAHVWPSVAGRSSRYRVGLRARLDSPQAGVAPSTCLALDVVGELRGQPCIGPAEVRGVVAVAAERSGGRSLEERAHAPSVERADLFAEAPVELGTPPRPGRRSGRRSGGAGTSRRWPPGRRPWPNAGRTPTYLITVLFQM